MPTNNSPDKYTFYWEWFMHEENLFTNRANFFLVGESMLFAGVATLLATASQTSKSALPAFYFLGIIISLIWLGTSIGHYYNTRIPIRNKLRLFDLHQNFKSTQEDNLFFKSHFWMGMTLPSVILIAWVWLFLI